MIKILNCPTCVRLQRSSEYRYQSSEDSNDLPVPAILEHPIPRVTAGSRARPLKTVICQRLRPIPVTHEDKSSPDDLDSVRS